MIDMVWHDTPWWVRQQIKAWHVPAFLVCWWSVELGTRGGLGKHRTVRHRLCIILGQFIKIIFKVVFRV